MSTNTWYPPRWAGRPRQMPVTDWAVWRAWLARHGHEYEAFAYDVELFSTAVVPTTSDQTWAEFWMRAASKRIDAVGRRRGRWTLFEARRRAGWQSVGQLIGYRQLWPNDYPTKPLEDAWLLTDTIDPAIANVAITNGLKIWTPSVPGTTLAVEEATIAAGPAN